MVSLCVDLRVLVFLCERGVSDVFSATNGDVWNESDCCDEGELALLSMSCSASSSSLS